MSRFTTSERRGAIVIIAIIALVTVYFAVSRGITRSAPEAIAQPAAVVSSDSTATRAGFSTSNEKKGKKKKQKKSKSRRESAKKSPTQVPARSPLDEPVSAR